MPTAVKMWKFIQAVTDVEDSEKPITYYNLRNLKNGLSTHLIKNCLDFCVALNFLHKYEMKQGERVSIHYGKTLCWPFLEDYLGGNA
jgi:hypothetical protein